MGMRSGNLFDNVASVVFSSTMNNKMNAKYENYFKQLFYCADVYLYLFRQLMTKTPNLIYFDFRVSYLHCG